MKVRTWSLKVLTTLMKNDENNQQSWAVGYVQRPTLASGPTGPTGPTENPKSGDIIAFVCPCPLVHQRRLIIIGWYKEYKKWHFGRKWFIVSCHSRSQRPSWPAFDLRAMLTNTTGEAWGWLQCYDSPLDHRERVVHDCSYLNCRETAWCAHYARNIAWTMPFSYVFCPWPCHICHVSSCH